jgi:hypothetical protein
MTRSSSWKRAKAADRLDEQVVDREPDRAAPVRISSEQAGRRFAGLVVDGVGASAEIDRERLVAVSVVERGEVEAAEAIRVGEDVEFGDSARSHRRAEK